MRFTSPILTLLLPGTCGILLHAANPVPPPAVPDTQSKSGVTIFQTVCAQCHGSNGEGKIELKTPSIAGMPAWYMNTQFANFREGRRGHDAADPQSFMMASIAKALQPEQVKAVVAHVEKMPAVIPTGQNREMAGVSMDEGMRLFQERCMECHRYNASGEMTFGSPPLTGLQAWYLEDQLRKFKTGKRGAAKDDINGAKMVQMTTLFIEDDQMLRDVVAYIMTLNPEPEVAKEPEKKPVEGNPFEGKQTAQR